MFCAFTSIGILPIACTASVWNGILCFRAIAPSSAIGSMVPISLLAYMMEMRMVLSVIAFSSSAGSTRPYWSTGRYVTVKPSFSRYSQVWRTAWCSIFEVMIWLPFFRFAQSNALDRPVVGLAPPGGEVNLIGFGTQCLCYLCPGSINRLLRLAGNAVDRGRVAEVFRVVGCHRFHDFLPDIRGCGVVHVDDAFFSHAKIPYPDICACRLIILSHPDAMMPGSPQDIWGGSTNHNCEYNVLCQDSY